MKKIKSKIIFLMLVGFLQISNSFVFGMKHKEDQECLLCLASTYYVTDDAGNLINKRKEEIPANTEGLRIGSEEDIVPVDPRFKTLVDERDRSKLIPIPDSQIVEISHVDNDNKHYLHTDCFKENMRVFMQNNPGDPLKCPNCNLQIQTAFTLYGTKIYTLEYETLWETQTSNGWNLGYKINKIEGFSQLKTHILSLEQQITVSRLNLGMYDGIHTIPENFFSELEIQKLCLENNDLTSLPESIGSLTSLKELSLGLNSLIPWPTQILQPLLDKNPQTIIYGKDTQSDNIEHINIEARENRLFLTSKIKRVEGFVPFKNYLLRLQKTYQATIAELTLIIDGNIHTIPEDFFSGLEIEKLCLNNNKLTSLPTSIGNLTSLKQLNLSYNNLTSLPPEIGNLSSLERLWIHFNHLIPWPNETLKHFSSDGYLIVTKSTQTLTKRQIQDWLRRKRRGRRRYQQIGNLEHKHQL